MSKPKAFIFTLIMLCIIFGMSYKMIKEDQERWSMVKSFYYTEEADSPKSAQVFMRKALEQIEPLLLHCEDQECLPLIILSGKVKNLRNVYQEYNCLEAEAHLKIFIMLYEEKIANALDFRPAERQKLAKTNPVYIQELRDAATNTIKDCPAQGEL